MGTVDKQGMVTMQELIVSTLATASSRAPPIQAVRIATFSPPPLSNGSSDVWVQPDTRCLNLD